jgi:hypothetical protein
MSHKGQHPRDPYRIAVTEAQIQENYDRTFRRKTKAEQERENAHIIAGFSDLYLSHDDPHHPEVLEYYRRYRHRKELRVPMNAMIMLRESIKEQDEKKIQEAAIIQKTDSI